MPELHTVTMPTPVGPLSLLALDENLLACGFTTDFDRLQAYLRGDLRAAERRPVRDLGPLSKTFEAYFDGDLDALDGPPADQAGTSFQRRGWEVLRSIPAGSTITYAQLAARAGNPAAVRAAGSVCARNALAPLVPCHRVVPSAGGVGNYGYGPHVKRWLLDHERRHRSPQLPLARGD